jgi:hypothetical protein
MMKLDAKKSLTNQSLLLVLTVICAGIKNDNLEKRVFRWGAITISLSQLIQPFQRIGMFDA